MLHFLAEGDPAPTGGGLTTIIMLVAMVGIFYFMLIRPESKRKKQAAELRSSIKVGDRITTIGGIVGTVIHIKDEKLIIETGADQVRMEIVKWAVSTNDSAAEAAAEAKKKAQEQIAKAKAEKKAEKANKKNK